MGSYIMILFYLITSPSGKQYVGITSQPFRHRWKIHIECAKRQATTCMGKAIRKYGAENFAFKKIIEVRRTTKIKEMESHFIHKYNTLAPNGYNMVDGGGGNWKGMKFSAERIARHKRALTKAHQKPEYRQAQSKRMIAFYNSTKGKARKNEMKKFLIINNPMNNPIIKSQIKKTRSASKYRIAKSIEQKEVWTNPELRKKHSKILREVYKNKPHSQAKKVKVKGVIYPSIISASRKLKIYTGTITNRIKKGINGYEYV